MRIQILLIKRLLFCGFLTLFSFQNYAIKEICIEQTPLIGTNLISLENTPFRDLYVLSIVEGAHNFLQNDILDTEEKLQKNIKQKNFLLFSSIISSVIVLILFYSYRRVVKSNNTLQEKNHIIAIHRERIKKAITELRNREKNLKQLNATKDKFFSIIAHDLKNPFNIIMGFSQHLSQEIDELSKQEIKEYLEQILLASQQGNNLLENLLEWSQSQTNRIKAQPRYININQLLKEVLLLLEPKAHAKQISITPHYLENAIAFADANMVKTILRNLISNSIKFTYPQGNINISFHQKKGFLVTQIKDDGVGMSQSQINKLFRIDSNKSTVGTSREKGNGLGLILCREFVEKNRGRIWVESQLKKGSSFFFTVPAN